MPTKSRRSSRPTQRADGLGALCRFSVSGLFGWRNVDFELDADEPTLLTGANGSGKSTVLRMVDAVSRRAWSDLLAIRFDRLVLGFAGNRLLSVSRDLDGLRLELTGEEDWHWSPAVSLTSGGVTFYMPATFDTYLTEIGDSWVHTSPAISSDSSANPYLPGLANRRPSMPEWVRELSVDFPVLYVTDERLISAVDGSEPQSGSTAAHRAVEEIATDIADFIQKALSDDYATTAQKIDPGFPERVIRAMESDRRFQARDLDQLLARVEEKREALRAVALLPGEHGPAKLAHLNFSVPNSRAVVSTFAEDTEKKLDSLEPARVRLELFSQFLRQHFGNKIVQLDRQSGLNIFDSRATDPSPIPLNRLSSGEQHVIVLAHQVLFRAKRDTLMLIDEPELSLHVGWQDTLVDDLTRMGSVNGLKFLLATHAPAVIAGRRDLSRSLDLP